MKAQNHAILVIDTPAAAAEVELAAGRVAGSAQLEQPSVLDVGTQISH